MSAPSSSCLRPGLAVGRRRPDRCGGRRRRRRAPQGLRARRPQRLDHRPPPGHARRDRLPARDAPRPRRSRTRSRSRGSTLTHDGKRDWAFFRKAAETVFWPRVDAEYRQEMQGIADGRGRGRGEGRPVGRRRPEREHRVRLLHRHPRQGRPAPARPDKCSAFVATGRYTRDGRPVDRAQQLVRATSRARAGT